MITIPNPFFYLFPSKFGFVTGAYSAAEGEEEAGTRGRSGDSTDETRNGAETEKGTPMICSVDSNH